MQLLLIVNQGPWGGTLAGTALRLGRAAQAADLRLAAVYFQGDGVYHALAGAGTDPGADDLHRAWSELAARGGAELLLCSAAAERRLPADLAAQPPHGYRLAGLATLLEWVRRCDRVVSF